MIEGRAHNGGGDKGGPRGRLNIVKNYLLWSSTTFDHSGDEENDEQDSFWRALRENLTWSIEE